MVIKWVYLKKKKIISLNIFSYVIVNHFMSLTFQFCDNVKNKTETHSKTGVTTRYSHTM